MKFINLFLKGMAVGVAHMVPGLSGSTFMVLMGIYNEFVAAIGNFFTNREMRRDYLAFLLPLGIGTMAGIVAFANLAIIVLDRYPAQTQFFFIGLVVGTIPGVIKIHHDMKPSLPRVIAFVLGLGLVVLLGIQNQRGVSTNFTASTASLLDLFRFAVVGFVGGGAMVTPGMDGSYVLILAGVYGPIMEALASLIHPPVYWGVLISVAVGAGLGIVLCSRLIDVALKRQPAVTYYAILGLICGSFVGLWPVGISAPPLACILTLAAGAGIAYLFSKLATNGE
jgi:putative membrane protein